MGIYELKLAHVTPVSALRVAFFSFGSTELLVCRRLMLAMVVKRFLTVFLAQWALFGVLVGNESPVFYPETEVIAPTEAIPSNLGTTNYDGRLEVSESVLALYEAFELESGALGARVRILDRVSLEEREVISLDDFGDDSGRGFSISLSDECLVVMQAGIDEEDQKPQLALYDLSGEVANRVVFQELDLEIGYGLQATGYGEDWVVWNSEETLLLSGVNGGNPGIGEAGLGWQ
ncbi:MAG: hypothetical protein ACJA16_004322 [Akkermansiaceae bacterium]